MTPSAFGLRLRELRRSHHLSQLRLAQAAGIATSTVFDYEHGLGAIIPETVARLADALGVQPDEMWIAAEAPPSPQPKRAIPMTIHTRIRELRQHLGIDQRELARRAGLSVATIQQIEEGNMQPSATTLARMARVLGTTAAELTEPDEW
jgi:transcriptional regulator with XRE-family HTH domain